jgi:hypothetical protein
MPSTEENTRPGIATYVAGKWLVSTRWRESSAATASPPWYYENFVWRIDPETKALTELLYTSSGIENHFALSKALLEHGEDGVKMIDPEAL